MNTETTFEVENLTTGNSVGEFSTLIEARRAARKLPEYAIYRGDGRRVEWCQQHPDDLLPPDDTPCLDRPWWESR